MVDWQRGQVRFIGMEVSKEGCSPSPGLGAKRTMAPVAMDEPAATMVEMARVRAMKSSQYQKKSSVMIPVIVMKAVMAAAIRAADLMMVNERSGTLSGRIMSRWAAVRPRMRAMVAGFQKYSSY